MRHMMKILAALSVLSSGITPVSAKSAQTETITGLPAGQNEKADLNEETEASVIDFEIPVKYRQIDARSELAMVNQLRTGNDAWYWADDNNETKVILTDLAELKYDYDLEKVAMQRAAETALFYSSTRADGKSRWTTYTDQGYEITGISYTENLTGGQLKAEDAFRAWEAADGKYSSQSARRTMLNAGYTAFAAACVEYGGRVYWVQEFSSEVKNASETEALNEEKDVRVSISENNIGGWKLPKEEISLFTGDTGEMKDVISLQISVKNSLWAVQENFRDTKYTPVWTSADPEVLEITDGQYNAKTAGETEITSGEYKVKAAVQSLYALEKWTWINNYTGAYATFRNQKDESRFRIVYATDIKSETTPATCAEEGKTVYTAYLTFEGKEYTDTAESAIAKLPHTLRHVEAKKEDCETDGNIEYWECEVCGEKFADEKGEKPLEEGAEVIKATGHDWGEWEITKEPTESEAGTRTRKCRRDPSHIQTEEIPPIGINEMFRLYNPNSGEHHYTADIKERDALIRYGWKYEGIGWYAPKDSATPVYRLYNKTGGEHHYTSDKAERDALINKYKWIDEGIGWHSDDAMTVPVFREYNPNAFANNHNYTPDTKEHDALINIYGWRDEGIGWYGVNYTSTQK